MKKTNQKKYVSKADALIKLQRYCAYQDRCQVEIEQKLRDYGVFTKDWPIILGMLQAEKFWDEERYVRSFSRGKFYHKKWGRNKIRHALKQKRIPDYLIEKVFAEEIPETEYQNGFDAVADKKLKELAGEEREKKKQSSAVS